MIVGENSRSDDLDVNITKEKKLTNMRASTSDDRRAPDPAPHDEPRAGARVHREDELVEVTPKTFRLRKKVLAAVRRR